MNFTALLWAYLITNCFWTSLQRQDNLHGNTAIWTDIERKYGVKTLSTARSESSGSNFRCSDRSERGWTMPGVSPVKESPLSWLTMLTEDKLFNLTYVEAIFKQSYQWQFIWWIHTTNESRDFWHTIVILIFSHVSIEWTFSLKVRVWTTDWYEICEKQKHPIQ